MKSNLHSPNKLTTSCDPRRLDEWFALELSAVGSTPLKKVLRSVVANLEEFVAWPEHALLLWYGCDRVPTEGKKQKYHSYPDRIKRFADKRGVTLDGRPNGPAIAAFRLAGGNRPSRFGSANAWSIHHLYSGKFPYLDRQETLHAVKNGLHFTQSAGLIATHPIADALSDEFPFFAWRLRAEAFNRFGYDPDNVFNTERDSLGFTTGCNYEMIYRGN